MTRRYEKVKYTPITAAQGVEDAKEKDYAIWVRRFCLVAFLMAAATWPTAAQSQLSPEAAQVAVEIGVAPLLKLLEGLPGSTMSMESLVLRQEITERVCKTLHRVMCALRDSLR